MEVQSTATSAKSKLPDMNVNEPEVDDQAIGVTFDFCQPKNSETPLKNIPDQDVSSEFSFSKPTLDKEDQITKGQLISKCPYEKSVLSKIPMKKFPRFLS